MKNNAITLFIPGLWALLRHAGSEMVEEMPVLQRLLKRCDSHYESTLESEALLLNHLGWQGSDNDDAPVAVLERLASDCDSDGFWFRADPVNLQDDQNYLMMSYPSVLDIELEEARALAESINQHFSEDGWQIEVASPQRWYLRLEHEPEIQTTPAWRAAGKDIFALMPAGKNSRQWHAWIMELQMLLFNHPVNEARNEKGLATVSSLWLWGGGRLPVLSNDQAMLYGDSLFLRGAARQSGCQINTLHKNLSDPVRLDKSSYEQLIEFEYARNALQSGSMEKGLAALKQVEKDIFHPLLDSLLNKNIHSLTIIDTPGFGVKISAGGIRKWWRNRKTLAAFSG